MKQIKLVTVLGTRPEIIRLSSTIKKLDKYFEHIVINTNQNYDYELNKIFFEDLKLRKANYDLNIKDISAVAVISKILLKVDLLLKKIKPDAFLVLGDTNSSLAAYAAKRNKIPIFHIEAGNRCFDENVPEEINRKIIDNIADINLTYSKFAKQNLLSEGFSSGKIIIVGSPLKEVFNDNKVNIIKSKILTKLKLKKNNFFLVSFHREENVKDLNKIKKFEKILNFLAEKYKLKIIVSTHPKTKSILEKNNIKFNNYIRLLKPLNYSDYVKLQISSKLIFSDSGSISEEASIIGLNALNIRENQERHEAFEEFGTPLVGLDIEKITYAIKLLENEPKNKRKIVQDYNEDNFSSKIVNIILSHINFVNKYIWLKNS